MPQVTSQPAPGATSGGDAPATIPALAVAPPPAAAAIATAAPAADAPAAVTAASPATPIRQVAAALVHLTQNGSGSTVTLRLDPGELGQVQVRIDRGADGTSTVHVAAEKPDTLRLLIADQDALHRTLNGAGVSQEGRTLSFSLSTANTESNASPDRGAGGFSGNGGFASGGGQQGGSGRQDRTPYADTVSPSPPSPAWLRAGVDITA